MDPVGPAQLTSAELSLAQLSRAQRGTPAVSLQATRIHVHRVNSTSSCIASLLPWLICAEGRDEDL